MKHIRIFLSIITATGCLAFNSSAFAAESQALEMAQQLNRAFIEVAEKVSPAVVVIQVTEKQSATQMSEDNPLWEMLPPDLRRRFFDEEGMPRQRSPRMGRGSGVVTTEDGYILTNNHVVENAEKITVRFKDSKSFPAKVVGLDPQSDLAVIKIEAEGLVPAKLGDSDATRVGEFAIALGAPFTLDYSVTVGHVSAKGRSVLPDQLMGDQDFIQTDASINPGNSGGPLVNLYGEVIGINSMIHGLNTGIGFAIPSNLAKQVMPHLIRDGKFTRSRIGVAIVGLQEDQDYKANVPPGIEDGVVVREILRDGPAAKSELKAGDVILTVDGKPVKTARELKEQISYKKVGQTVNLDVARVGVAQKFKNLKIKIKTAAFPGEEDDIQQSSATDTVPTNFGLSVRPLTGQLADEYGIDMTSGILVTAVEERSPAAMSGIKAGDVITEVNRTPVSTLKQFNDAMSSPDSKTGVVVNFTSNGSSRITVLKKEE